MLVYSVSQNLGQITSVIAASNVSQFLLISFGLMWDRGCK